MTTKRKKLAPIDAQSSAVVNVGRKNKLQTRLTAFVLAITLPILIVVVSFVSSRAGTLLKQNADEQLQATNRALAANVSVWLDFNIKTLYELVNLPDIISMDAARQKPILEAKDAAYPHLYLVHTTDVNGINVARNDDQENKDYSDRPWYQGAMAGNPVTFQSLVSRTTGNPALVIATSIKDESGQIVGVGSIGSELDDIAQEVKVSKVGKTGFAYVVDAENRAVAHPDPEFSTELRDLSDYPPIVALRQGTRGLITFTDEAGQEWRAYVSELDNGWGIVIQQQTVELLNTLRLFQQVSWSVTAIGLFVLLGLLFWVSRRALRPIETLTVTATAIAAGDLDRTAPVESDDEIGVLANAFNSMTEQLRNLIGSLEQGITTRTQRLEIIATLNERLNAILNFDQLLDELVNQVKESFNYYHAHIYIIDDYHQNLVMTAGAGEVGAKMKAKGHHIPLNAPTSLVARAARTGEVVWVDNVREAEDWLPNPLLPDTYSEMAVPILLEGQVVGVLDIQEDEMAGFDEADASLLRSLSNQVAVAIRNTRLFTEVETALAEARTAQERYLEQSWDKARITVQERAHLYLRPGMSALAETIQTEAKQQALQQARPAIVSLDNGHSEGKAESHRSQSIVAPVTVGNTTIGALQIHQIGGKDKAKEWTDEDLALVEAVLDQVAQAAENLRLFDETRQQVSYEHLVSEISEKLRQAPTLEILARTAAEELGQALGAAHSLVKVGITPEAQAASNRTSQPENGHS